MSMSEIVRIIKEWFSRDHTRLALAIGIFSAGLVGYSLGILRNMTALELPITMSIVAPQEKIGEIPAIPAAETVLGKTDTALKVAAVGKQASDCLFVGSRNSTLYHLPTCAPAKRIKEANRVCFASQKEAEAKGYKPGCLR